MKALQLICNTVKFCGNELEARSHNNIPSECRKRAGSTITENCLLMLLIMVKSRDRNGVRVWGNSG